MNNGYPLEWFVEPIDDYLKCGICEKVLHSPRATSCGHVFCFQCLKLWIERYGICPDRCGEVEAEQLRKAVHIEKRISGLLARCKYYLSGCPVQVLLADKHRHEKLCQYRRTERLEDLYSRRLYKRSRNSSTSTYMSAPEVYTTKSMQSQHTYRLKRSRPREPLGLVLASGDKLPDGRYRNFFVKKVKRDTLAWKAGIQPGDKIVQVDLHDLGRIVPQEAVARIKDKPVVTLTVLRGDEYQQHQVEEHIYDEILYADLCPGLSQPDENYIPALYMASVKDSPVIARKNRAPMQEDVHNRPCKMVRPVSPSANYTYRTTSSAPAGKTHQSGEKGSKDSGLSSGSSGSPHQFTRHNEIAVTSQRGLNRPYPGSALNLDRGVGARHSYRTEREMLRNFLKSQKRSGHTHQLHAQSSKRRNCRIEGDYEVEEIYLQKNGTSQLGVTLGYDTSTPEGHLYVCEVLPTGLASEDGRLQCGDLIKRVNGFEVYDAEEAILLFLEQDQDITLTVARKIKATSSQLLLPNQSDAPIYPETNFELLESKVTGGRRDLRRADSCGSLDSHIHKYECEEAVVQDCQIDEPLCTSGESLTYVREESYGEHTKRSRASSSPLRHCQNMSQHVRNPSPLCNDFLSQQLTTTQYTSQPDYGFRPVSVAAIRPKTAGGDSRPSNPRKIPRPSSATPESRHRICPPNLVRNFSSSAVDYKPKIMTATPPTRKAPQSFRTRAAELRQLPSRCETTTVDYVYSRSESLV